MSGISKLYINQKLAIHRFENGNELSEYLDPMKLYGRHCEAKPSTKKVVREANRLALNFAPALRTLVEISTNGIGGDDRVPNVGVRVVSAEEQEAAIA